MKRKFLSILAAGCLAGVAGQAMAIDTRFIPAQATATGPLQPLGDFFEREVNTKVGAEAYFAGVLFDLEGNYLMPEGTEWEFVWKQLSPTPFVLTRSRFQYIGGEDSCWSFGYCGPLRSVSGMLSYQCAPEQVHSIELYHNGVLVGTQVFKPTPFHVEVANAYLSSPEIPPAWSAVEGYPSGTTGVYVELKDTLDCFAPLADTKARVESFIKPGSGGHAHFTDAAELGTGTFISYVPGSDVREDGLMVEAPVNQYGRVGVFYRAGEFGVDEVLKVRGVRELALYDNELIETDPTDVELKIAIPDLMRITSQDAPVVFADGGSCPHQPLPHYFTTEAWTTMRWLAEMYYVTFLGKLSLNDATLPYGGKMDNKLRNGGGRDTACHLSHRVGIDIDVNKFDTAGNLLRDWTEIIKDDAGNVVKTIPHACTKAVIDGIELCHQDVIARWAKRYGGSRMIEDFSIHYRLKPTTLQ